MVQSEVKCKFGIIKYKTKFTLAEKLEFEGRLGRHTFAGTDVGIASLYARIIEEMESYVDFSGLLRSKKKFKDYKELQYEVEMHEPLMQICAFYYVFLYPPIEEKDDKKGKKK